MRLKFPACCRAAAILALSVATLYAQAPYDSVNPLIGTSGGGNTFPGATLPFGMMQWSPDTNGDAWYRYDDKSIYGFSLTHISGAGCPLYGDFAVLPIPGELTTSPGANIAAYAQAFDHSTEQAHPGYYAVTLANGVRVEITVAERAGIARFTFPAGTPARLLVNAGSSTHGLEANHRTSADVTAQGDENEISLAARTAFAGWSHAGHFCSSRTHYTIYIAGSFDKPYKTTAIWQNDAILKNADLAHGAYTGAWLDFGNARQVTLKVGISFVSEQGARINLAKEIPGWNFETIHKKAREEWSDLLNRFSSESGTPAQRTIFYTGVYHSFLSPNTFSDEDGQYIGFDNKIHSLAETHQQAQYANFSDWDIYRNTVELQTLFFPQQSSDMMQSLVNDAEQSGQLPRWPAANDVTYVMGGDSPAAVIASAYAFGARNFDAETALKYMVKAATQTENNRERPFLKDYLTLGYVPSEKDRISASRTLEYSSDDFAISQLAKSLGHADIAEKFRKQSQNWKNLLDPSTGWIRPRLSDGTWLPGFDAERSLPKGHGTDQLGFEEGNTYQYTYMIPFDYPALFADIGGDAKVTARLDKFFVKLRCWGEPCYNIENEPDFVVPYAYVFAGQPWKTQEVVTRINAETFKNAPDGIPGNDDLGATSGVYVWNALGFYPAVPGVSGLVLGTPQFTRTTLRLANGRTVEIRKDGSGIYVRHVTLNNMPYASTWLPIEKLRTGTTRIVFTTQDAPDTKRGTAEAHRPPAFR